MENSSLKQTRHALDDTLQSLPARLRELFETVHYNDALRKMEDAEDPNPEWITTQLRALRVKARTIQAAVLEMAETLATCLAHYTDSGGTDALRIAHAQEELLFLKQTADDYAAQSTHLAQLRQNTELLQKQGKLLDALAVEQFRLKLGKTQPDQRKNREEQQT